MIAKGTIWQFLTSTFFLLLVSRCPTFTLALLTTPSVTTGRRSNSKAINTHPYNHHHHHNHHRHSNKIVQSPLFLSTKDSSFLVPPPTSTPTPSSSSSSSSSPEEERRVARLRQLSNVASLLCVLDCTLLPLVTVVVPLLGSWTHTTASQLDALHRLGHSLAVWFVLPVGTSTTVVNYYLSHRNPWLVGLASVGLGLIGLANLHLPANSAIVTSAGSFIGGLHSGVGHRVVNLLGCAMLLGSNYISQRLGCGCGVPHENNNNNNNNNVANGSGSSRSTTTSTTTRTPMAMQTSLIRWKKANGIKK